MPPVGSWDFVLSGSQQGVAHVHFKSDHTLTGTAVLTYSGRNALRTNQNFIYTNLFGAAELRGEWAYSDGTSRIVGFLNQLTDGTRSHIQSTGTNLVVTTNWVFELQTNGPALHTNIYVALVTNDIPLLVPDRVTNSLSFRAVVKPGGIALAAFGNQGALSWKGIPLLLTNDLTASYQGTGQKKGVPFSFIDLFTLTSRPGVTNQYDVLGSGGSRHFAGLFLVSRQRVAAFFQNTGTGTSNSPIAAYAGPFNTITKRGSFKGTDGIPVPSYAVRTNAAAAAALR